MDPTNCEEGWATDRWVQFTNKSTDFKCEVPVVAFEAGVGFALVLQIGVILALAVVFCTAKTLGVKAQLFVNMLLGSVGLVLHGWSLLAPQDNPFSSTEQPVPFFTLYALWLGALFASSLYGAFVFVRLSLLSVPKGVTNGAGIQLRRTSPWENTAFMLGAGGGLFFTLGGMLVWAVGVNLAEPSEQVGECKWCGQELWWNIGCICLACTLLSLLVVAIGHIRTLRKYISASLERTKEMRTGAGGEEATKRLEDTINKLAAGERVALGCGAFACSLWLLHAFILPMYWWIQLGHFLNAIVFQMYSVYLYRPSNMKKSLGFSSSGATGTASSKVSEKDASSNYQSSSPGEGTSVSMFAANDPSDQV